VGKVFEGRRLGEGINPSLMNLFLLFAEYSHPSDSIPGMKLGAIGVAGSLPAIGRRPGILGIPGIMPGIPGIIPGIPGIILGIPSIISGIPGIIPTGIV
jgi:hypothetical protein